MDVDMNGEDSRAGPHSPSTPDEFSGPVQRGFRAILSPVRSIRRYLAGAAAAASLCALPVDANPFGDRPLPSGFILAAANAAGSHGTYWKTDVWIHNAGSDRSLVALYFLPAGRPGEAVSEGQVRIEPGETSEISDIIGLGIHRTDAVGALEYRVIEGPDVFVQSRTYSNSGDSAPIEASSAAEAATAANPLRLSGLRRSPAFRSNLSLVNPLAKPVEVIVESFDDEGHPVATLKVALDARSYLAVNDLFAGAGIVRNGSALVRPEGEGRILAIGSVLSSETASVTVRPAARELP